MNLPDEVYRYWGAVNFADVMADWLLGEKGFKPATFLTLTFRQKGKDGQDLPLVSAAQAWWWWRQLVRRVNVDAGGRHYLNKFSHSYFGYVAGLEYQKNGWAHLHAVVDNWIDYALVTSWWFENCGFNLIKPLNGDARSNVAYVFKYVVKTGLLPAIWLRRDRVEIHRLDLNRETGGMAVGVVPPWLYDANWEQMEMKGLKYPPGLKG